MNKAVVYSRKNKILITEMQKILKRHQKGKAYETFMSLIKGTQKMRYQFQIDNRPAAPIREKWEDAANDLVNDGYGVWVYGIGHNTIRMNEQASIVRINDDDYSKVSNQEFP